MMTFRRITNLCDRRSEDVVYVDEKSNSEPSSQSEVTRSPPDKGRGRPRNFRVVRMVTEQVTYAQDLVS